ncbi:MAG TPA: phospholipase [Burkholderiaceae bacterium]|nr:phospholipase [Burkholderiaceae bacterium]
MTSSPRPMSLEARVGLHCIDAGARRAAWARVPALWQATRASALAVMLHGSGDQPEHGLALLEPYAAATNIIVLALPSTNFTWDAIIGRFGPDIKTIQHGLHWVYERYAIDPLRVAVGGFSDGASYALSLAVGNGRLFSHAIALSPGFIPSIPTEGHIPMFISHGTRDGVLPIDRCSQPIVLNLRRDGHAVEYHEFDGGHMIPHGIAQAAVDWFMR